MIQGNNFDDLYKDIIHDILTQGKKVSPRGLSCYEKTAYSFELTDISRSLLTLKERKFAYKFNAAEKLCYVSGNGGEEILPRYAKNIVDFINPVSGKFDGAYGPRLIKQFEYVLDLLRHDPDTRQAVINIFNYYDDLHPSKDIPCTCILQFLNRNNKLNLIVYMRSNDLLWGTPYDVSQFTFIQECFANILGIGLGTYTHIAGSLHIYEKDVELFKRILESDEINDQKQLPVEIISWEQLQDQATITLHGKNEEEKLLPYFKQLNRLLWN